MDPYLRHLTNCITEIEGRYGLDTFLPSTKTRIIDLNMEEFIEETLKHADTFNEQEKLTVNIKAGQKVAMISYLMDRLNFFEYVRLDFRLYPSLDKILECLTKFTNAKTVTEEAKVSTNVICEVLATMEEKSIKSRLGLGYRSLRLFLVLLVFGNTTDACVLANLIVTQIILYRRNLNDDRSNKRTREDNRRFK